MSENENSSDEIEAGKGPSSAHPSSLIPDPSSLISHLSPIPNRLAWALACGTLFLIWVGGHVTTYGAGMAVPDWPNTYGYNLFLYPLESWLAVWDVFLEHSHRLIAATVGLITIALAVAVWLLDRRRWMRWLVAAAFVGVCSQGVLGGLRVLGNDLFLAKVHGCTAPVFFALCAALVTLTSRGWQQAEAASGSHNGNAYRRFAIAAAVLIYVQIVLGANLRHLPPDAGTGWFELWVWLHLITAGCVLASAVLLWRLAVRRLHSRTAVVRRGRLLAALVLVQVLLGLATWVVKYGFPRWFHDYLWAVEYTVAAKGRLQTLTVTTHVAVGSLSLAAALCLALWSHDEQRSIPTAD